MMSYQRGSKRKHEEIKQLILKNPELVGINAENVISMKTEFPLIKRKRQIAKPDILIEYEIGNERKRMFVEVKSGSCWRALNNLKVQLKRVERFLHNKKIQGEVVGVYCAGDLMNLMIVQ